MRIYKGGNISTVNTTPTSDCIIVIMAVARVYPTYNTLGKSSTNNDELPSTDITSVESPSFSVLAGTIFGANNNEVRRDS